MLPFEITVGNGRPLALMHDGRQTRLPPVTLRIDPDTRRVELTDESRAALHAVLADAPKEKPAGGCPPDK